MGERIDPREVLTYLNELGYTNISAHQLKEFIKDLTKIIKYDYRTREHPPQRRSESVEYEYLSDHSSDGEENCSSDKENFVSVHSAKENLQPQKPPTEKHIAVHIYEKKSKKCIDHEHCIHTCVKEGVNKIQAIQTIEISSKPETTTESSVQPIAPPSSRELNSRVSRASSKDRKSKVAFIRPTISKPTINKTDPVALYHYYQSQWKKAKIPGQENRDDLRWAIREKMLSGPKVEVRSRCSSTTPRSVCFR